MSSPAPATVLYHVEQIRSQWNAVWPHLGPDIRSALVDARVAVAVTGLDRDAVEVAWVDALRDDLHRIMSTGGHAR